MSLEKEIAALRAIRENYPGAPHELGEVGMDQLTAVLDGCNKMLLYLKDLKEKHGQAIDAILKEVNGER